nr:hypothetical protein Iba_chr08eCG3360 [Ipomoea batatas]
MPVDSSPTSSMVSERCKFSKVGGNSVDGWYGPAHGPPDPQVWLENLLPWVVDTILTMENGIDIALHLVQADLVCAPDGPRDPFKQPRGC